MSTTYRLAPLPADAFIPDGQQHTGYTYRAENRRIQLTLRPDGKVTVYMRRLLTHAEAEQPRPPDTATQVVRGRVLHTLLVLSMDAVSAFAHFANEVQVAGSPPDCVNVRPVHGPIAP